MDVSEKIEINFQGIKYCQWISVTSVAMTTETFQNGRKFTFNPI